MILETVATNTPNFALDQYTIGDTPKIGDDYVLVNGQFEIEGETNYLEISRELWADAIYKLTQQDEYIVATIDVADDLDTEDYFAFFARYNIIVTPVTA